MRPSRVDLILSACSFTIVGTHAHHLYALAGQLGATHPLAGELTRAGLGLLAITVCFRCVAFVVRALERRWERVAIARSARAVRPRQEGRRAQVNPAGD